MSALLISLQLNDAESEIPEWANDGMRDSRMLD
jgi:hypothetical protein